ncbi:MAG: thiamine pyrophosphate-dependent enzyme, partial [Anaerolineae bacterium]|nr:thiamine pyrophosphate-dependent enzyme [Anaerolineae bacterium]
PMNTQGAALPGFNLDELPVGPVPGPGPAADDGAYARAADLLLAAERVVVKIGGGAGGAGQELAEFLALADAVLVPTPIATGVVPYAHPRNMTVGGSKGSLCGNYAMEHADLLVAVGTRAVCQSDCSRTGYPRVKQVININADPDAALHYGKTLALIGDAASTLRRLNQTLRERLELGRGQAPAGAEDSPPRSSAFIRVQNPEHIASASPWLAECTAQKRAWEAFKAERYARPTLWDAVWGREVLTQPAAIKAATDWARGHDVVAFFDAGDVQANGFQIVEDDRPGRTVTETGASYMGFAVSALLATAASERPFYGLALTGDGSFTMNPQILIDGVQHGARGCILLLDNRRMGAITGLQEAQYGHEFATADQVPVDYLAWARAVPGVQALAGGDSVPALLAALDRALGYEGLTLIHVPVYFGPDPLGGMGVFGRWNVGNWCTEVQALRHDIGL